jgi:hypothetical protein
MATRIKPGVRPPLKWRIVQLRQVEEHRIVDAVTLVCASCDALVPWRFGDPIPVCRCEAQGRE